MIIITGRDLIIYILENNLEDECISDGENLLGFMTEEEAAKKFNVGINTVRVWYKLSMLKGIKVGEKIFFFDNQKCPD